MRVIFLNLIDDWKSGWRLWSIRLHVIATAIGGFFLMTPQMPEEIQNLLPMWARPVAIAVWLLLGIYVRLAKQGEPRCSQD